MMTITRRAWIKLAAGMPLLGTLALPRADAQALTIGRLIDEARPLPLVAQRIAHISRALKGRPYMADTLIGGPGLPERFVVRDDAFDCVTYCEVVLAAARSRDLAGYETALKRLRYADGQVTWQSRNHYFSEWIGRAVAGGIAQPVPVGPAVRIERIVDYGPFGRRQVAIHAFARDVFAAGRSRLATGDIVGFVARRPNLDFFHTGFVVFDERGQWMLRHASRRHRRVIDEPMEGFLATNGVRHVALVRPTDPFGSKAHG